MSAAPNMKTRLYQWVDDQQQLGPREALILTKMAAYADADGCAWSKVATLAYESRSSERTVHYVLRKFEADGLIRDTGRKHRLDGTTRDVPIYQLAPEVEGLGMRGSIPAKAAGVPVDGCKSGGGIPAIRLQTQEIMEFTPSDEGDASARDRLFERLEAAYPKRGLGFTNRGRARSELWALLDAGLDGELLVRAAVAYAADRSVKRADQGLDHWLADGKYRGWWPEPQLALDPGVKAATEGLGEHAAPEADQAVWRAVLDQLAEALPGGDFVNYVRPAALGVVGGALHVVALTGYGREQIKARIWRRLTTTWAEADAQARPLTLVSRHDFEALVRQSEGVS